MKHLFFLFISLSLAHASIVPTNHLSIPAGLKSSEGLTEEEFHAVLKDTFDLFERSFIEQGLELIYMPLWSDRGVNAFSNKSRSKCRIFFLGGLARFPGMTRDAYTQVVCHELGHFLSGAPRKPNSWGSAEGQADYYSTQTCLRGFWKENYEARAFLSSLQLSLILSEISGEEAPSLQSKDTSIAEKTKTSYPAIQCRLDTYVAGARNVSRPGCWFKE